VRACVRACVCVYLVCLPIFSYRLNQRESDFSNEYIFGELVLRSWQHCAI